MTNKNAVAVNNESISSARSHEEDYDGVNMNPKVHGQEAPLLSKNHKKEESFSCLLVLFAADPFAS